MDSWTPHSTTASTRARAGKQQKWMVERIFNSTIADAFSCKNTCPSPIRIRVRPTFRVPVLVSRCHFVSENECHILFKWKLPDASEHASPLSCGCIIRVVSGACKEDISIKCSSGILMCCRLSSWCQTNERFSHSLTPRFAKGVRSSVWMQQSSFHYEISLNSST